MAASAWLSWILTWGDDWPLSVAALFCLCLGLLAGQRLQLCRMFGWLELAVAACTWTLLQPWLTICLVSPLKFVSVEALASDFNRVLLGLVCSLPTWFVFGAFWSSITESVITPQSPRQFDATARLASLAFGIACGLGFSIFCLAPWIGTWNVVALAAVCLVAVKLAPEIWLPVDLVAQQRDDNSHSLLASDVDESRQHAVERRWISETNRILAIAALGGLLAAVTRLAGQLMPGGCQFLCAEWIGVLVGIGLGQLCTKRGSDPQPQGDHQNSNLNGKGSGPVFVQSRFGQLFLRSRRQVGSSDVLAIMTPAAAGAGLLMLFPWLIHVSLWMTTTLTVVSLLIACRVVLLSMATAPIGFALGCLARGAAFRTESDHGYWRYQSPILLQSVVLLTGFAAAESSFAVVSLSWLLCGCTFLLVGSAMVSLLASERAPLTRWGWLGLTGCAALGLSVPLWRSHDDPASIARLLFSTPVFVAHREGLDAGLLSMLDDAHVIDKRDGICGRWTLWRSRGTELHLRMNGIPRAVISSNVEAHPRLPPAVLQAVFPLSIVSHPQRILILGASGGVPLQTCLQFPVQQVVCVEDDSTLIDILQGPVAHETGSDPFADDRTRLVEIPPATAIMAGRNTYDVILSSPASSVIPSGAAAFTVDYYQHASRHLADGGVFAQRFEGIDYGPQPLRLVILSLRQAFREVVAIETAVGEILLLATNTNGVFIPDDLPARLQRPHVQHVLAECGLDWSTLLNMPAYDHQALGEICAESWSIPNTCANGLLAIGAPLELVRWGSKLQEVQQVLTARRTTESTLQKKARLESGELGVASNSRKSRILEWLGDELVPADVLRRLAEVAAQQNLVREFPESELHWWEYRKVLRQQLQEQRQSVLKQVAHSDEDQAPTHPDDEHRKQFLVALGRAQAKLTVDRISDLESLLQPYDPLISFFAHQEIADLLSRAKIDPGAELIHRLHAIQFAPASEASTRNVASTLELVVKNPQAVSDAEHRYDLLNGLIQTLWTRWQARRSVAVRSPRMQLGDVDRSIVAVEKAVATMESLHADAGISEADWQNRRRVIDRILLRPLRTYHTQLHQSLTHSETRTRSLVEGAGKDAENPGR